MKSVLIGMQATASERNFKGIGSRGCIPRNHTSFYIMETKVVTRINGVEILASNVSDGLVAIKPVCDGLGVDYSSQYQKLKEHPTFNSTISLITTVAADGKEREMLCIPIEFFPGWLFSINPANVKEEIRDNLIRFQIECNKALFRYFFGTQKKVIEQNTIEIKLLEELAELNQQKATLATSIAEKKKQLDKLREERLKDEPGLFD